MKCYLLLLLAAGLFNSNTGYCQVYNKKTIPIHKICNQLDKDNSLRKVVSTGNLSGLPVSGKKQLTGFYKDSTLVKMILKGKDNVHIETIIYYYHNNDLICIHNAEFWPQEKNGKTIYERSLFDGWYYFRKGEKIEEISTGHNRFENDELDSGKILPDEAKQCRQLLP